MEDELLVAVSEAVTAQAGVEVAVLHRTCDSGVVWAGRSCSAQLTGVTGQREGSSAAQEGRRLSAGFCIKTFSYVLCS